MRLLSKLSFQRYCPSNNKANVVLYFTFPTFKVKYFIH